MKISWQIIVIILVILGFITLGASIPTNTSNTDVVSPSSTLSNAEDTDQNEQDATPTPVVEENDQNSTNIMLTSGDNEQSIIDWFKGFLLNISTELFGAALIYVLIDVIKESQEKEKNALQEVTRKLISRHPALVSDAIQQILFNEKLKNKLFSQENIPFTHMMLDNQSFPKSFSFPKIDISHSEFRQAILKGVTFVNTIMHGVNFEQADLASACLKNCDLQASIFDNADLSHADLSGCKLEHVDFTEANLTNANLTNAIITDTTQLTGAKLPSFEEDERGFVKEGSIWQKHTDMKRFTDPNHPNYYVVHNNS